MSAGLVSVTIVTFNSARYIRECLGFLLEQTYQPIEVVVVDNASSDSTVSALEPFRDRVRLVLNTENKGFAGGQNQAIALCRGHWILTLNSDVRLPPDFVQNLVNATEAADRIGTVCGKLLAMADNFEIRQPPTIDSTGIYFTPSLRHFDRGSKELDRGQYDSPEYVFGATGAAAFYRREMIEDVSLNGEFFDEDFFVYREDADVSWRAQLFGWRCLYTPDAVAYHVRAVLPSNRRSVPAMVNMHSVKNRFLMRINNVSVSLYARHFLAITVRDLVVIGGCLISEWSSLRAFAIVLRDFPRAWAKRRLILSRRRVTEDYMTRWFSPTPFTLPVSGAPSSLVAKGRATSI